MLLPFYGGGEGFFYHFDKIERRIASPIFERYVRPQLKNIVHHYFSLLESVEPKNGKLLRLKSLLDNSHNLFGNPKLHCRAKTDKKCLETLTEIANAHYSIDYEINILLQSLMTYQGRRVSNGDSLVIFRDKLSGLFKKNLAVIYALEEVVLLSHTPYQIPKGKFDKLATIRHTLELNFDQMVTLLLPENVNGDFSVLYLNFIKSLDQRIVGKGKDLYLMQNLEKFNNLWNTFHMKMTKSTIKLNEQSVDTIQLIHQRWNSVLKLLLRRWDKEEGRV